MQYLLINCNVNSFTCKIWAQHYFSVSKSFIHVNSFAIESVNNNTKAEIGYYYIWCKSDALVELHLHNYDRLFFVVAFTVCATQKTYSRGSSILFPDVKTKYGVSNSTLSTFGSSGLFRCEKAGLYLISGFLMTDT